MPKYLANLLLLFVAIIWGAAFIAQVTAMDAIGPMQFIGVRYLVAAIALIPFAIYELMKSRHTIKFTTQNWIGIIATGLSFFVATTMQQIALLGASVTNAGFLTALYAVATPLIMFALRDKQHPIIWPCAVASVIGVFMLGGGKLEGLTWGDWVLFISAFFWATQIVITGKVVQKIGHPFFLVMVQFFISSSLGILGYFLIAPIMSALDFSQLAIEKIEPRFNGALLMQAMGEILYVGLVSSAFAFSMQAIAQRYTTSAEAAILMSAESLFAALFAALLLGERLPIIGYWGCALIFTVVIVVQVVPILDARKARRRQRREACKEAVNDSV
jgi:drug/metabolite transporter (DMT)-like permease